MEHIKTIDLSEILISEMFRQHPPSVRKIAKCYAHYKNTKTLDRNITIDKNNILTDGYVAYLICRLFGIKSVKVKEVAA